MHHRTTKVLFNHVFAWTCAFALFTLIRNVGTTEVSGLDMEPSTSIILIIVLGLVFGGFSGLGYWYFSERFYRRIRLKAFLLLRLTYSLTFLLMFFISIFFINHLIFPRYQEPFLDFISTGTIAIAALYLLIIDFSLSFFGQINLMLGKGNIAKILSGKFYEPQEEDRIFMFLDLKSSTTIAESIGHLKYSRMIQDCFNDISVVDKYRAQIYQYVGDEVIITWKFEDGFKNNQCLKAFFEFIAILDKKRGYYISRYGHFPEFKAGVHVGKVTTSEVGKYKREIAYHGDTINTASRIQDKCNDLKSSLLISKKLKENLNIDDNIRFDYKGSYKLKGKDQDTELWKVYVSDD